ncbi:hypothetical protein T484DRAFT_1887988 [Baffinella frigidus]|nr:hypothetical protein T484DRAFT_1887988 [Cryptophyta sp. CCMP2293]
MQVPMDFSRSPKVGNVATALHQMSSGDLASSLTTLRVSSDDMDAVAYGDGSGTLEVFRVANFKLEKEEVKHFGHFYAGDSYVMLYSYLDDRGRDAWVIYFWLGRHSSIDEIGTAALEAKRLDDERGGTPVQVRVVQNKEPTHLLRLFKGKFIVFNGGNPSAFRRAASAEQEPQNGQGLFHVRGTTALNTRAVQVSQETSSLNSSDVFVLMEAERALVWYGRMCSPSERTAGLLIGESLCGSAALASPAEQVEEGSEPDWFWQALGGKGEYAAGAPAEDAAAAPRLFHGSNASGVFSAKEIADFAQEDLLPEDVYILDIWSELFVWIGPDATEVERAGVESLAQAFTQRQGQDRQGTPISTVLAGKEPRSFTCHFLGWDDTKAAVFEDPYEKKLLEMKSNANNSSSASAQSPAPQSAGSSPWGSQVKRRTPQQQDPLQETPPSTPEMPSLRSRATPSPQPASQAGPSPGGNPFGHVVLRKSVPPPDFSPTAPNAPNASEGIPAVTLRSPKLGASPTPPAAHTTIPTVALRAAKAPSDFAPVIPPPPGGTPPLPASGASPPSASASSVAERAPRGVAMGAATAQRSAGNYGGYGGPSLPAGAAAEEARPQLRSVSLRAAPATDKVEGSTDAAEGIAMPQLRATGRAFQELGKTPPAMGDEASSGGPADLFGAGRLKKTEVGKATAPAGGDHESGGGQQDPFGAGRLKKTGRDLGERKPPSMPAGATNDVSRAALRAVAPPSAVAAPGDAGSAAASPASAGTPDAPAAAPPVLPPPPATTNSPPVSAPPQNQELGAPAAFTNRAGAVPQAGPEDHMEPWRVCRWQTRTTRQSPGRPLRQGPLPPRPRPRPMRRARPRAQRHPPWRQSPPPRRPRSPLGTVSPPRSPRRRQERGGRGRSGGSSSAPREPPTVLPPRHRRWGGVTRRRRMRRRGLASSSSPRDATSRDDSPHAMAKPHACQPAAAVEGSGDTVPCRMTGVTSP